MSEKILHIASREVFGWPEFKALAKRLQIPCELSIRYIQLYLHCESFVEVTVEFMPQQTPPKS